jgi:thiamine transport system substrate-binding protein
MTPHRHRRASVGTMIGALIIGALMISALSSCTDDAADTTAASADTTAAAAADTTVAGGVPTTSTITLVAYDSFALSKGVLERFTAATGIGVKVLTAGDTGEMVNKSVLTKDAPLGDVMWGVDNTFLDRALDEKLFTAADVDTSALDPKLVALVPGKQLVPVDYGDVCVNYDKAELTKRGIEPPSTFADLTKPEYKDLLVVENPATSSPGLAFLLGSIAAGAPGKTGSALRNDSNWKTTWQALKDNGALVVDGWSEAYDTHFSAGSGKGDRPLVVSYASSPPAAVLFGPDPAADVAPTGVAEGTCFRQVEFAGVLTGTKHPKEAASLLTFLMGTVVQEDMQLNMFVFPANTSAKLADAFVKFAARPAEPLTMDPAAIAANRDRWIDQWSTLML